MLLILLVYKIITINMVMGEIEKRVKGEFKMFN